MEPNGQMDSRDDLMAYLRMLPEQDRFRCLGIIQRMRNGKMSASQGAAQIKELLFKNGIFEE
ncbi:hypothetical protein [Paenibacillus medicaginis]|uniref:Uncharacterized protein n=1 Tax=Paenibacillus medicaginis TaxID=1470560 RepID=A0ABV5C0K5_9BACL